MVSEKCWWAPDPTLPAKGTGDKLMRSPWRRAARPMMSRVKGQLIGGGHRCQRRQRDLELVGPVLGMELLDPDTGRGGRGVDIANEGLVFEHAGKAILGPAASSGSRPPSGSTRRNSISWPIIASMPASASAASTRLSVPRLHAGSGVPSCSKKAAGRPRQPVADDAATRRGRYGVADHRPRRRRR